MVNVGVGVGVGPKGVLVGVGVGGAGVLVGVFVGVEVGVPTDHDHVTDLGPAIADLGVTGQLVTGVGNEVSVLDYGEKQRARLR